MTRRFHAPRSRGEACPRLRRGVAARAEDADLVRWTIGRQLPLIAFVIAAMVTASGPRVSVAGGPPPGGAIHTERGTPPGRSLSAAGDPGRLPHHNGETLTCSDCHVTQTGSEQGDRGAAGSGSDVPGRATPTSPGKLLLKYSDPLRLCLSCHDNVRGIPDVVGEDINGLADRAAGYFDEPDFDNPRGHALGLDLQSAGQTDACGRCHAGDIATARVTCIDCHSPHGNGNPRNLRWASDPSGTPPLGLFIAPGATGMSRYERANIAYGTDNASSLREVTSICIDCHHFFSGQRNADPDRDGIHSRHPSYDSERGSRTPLSMGILRRSTDPAHWEQGRGAGFRGLARVPFLVDGATSWMSARAVNAGTNGVFCLSCHRAHGSGSAFSLVWPTDGNGSRGGCLQCHSDPGGR